MHKAPFCIENNSRENRFFAATHPLDDKKDTHNVKKSTKNITLPPIHNRPLPTQIAQKKTFRRFGKACTPTMCGNNAHHICGKTPHKPYLSATHHPPVGTNTTNAIRWTI